MNQKLKYLFSNVGWMTVSNFASKILIFLLVPLYTRYLTTEEYGTYDLAYTAVILVTPLLTASISESLMRFALSQKDKVRDYFSVAFALSGAISIVSVAAAVATLLIFPDGLLAHAIAFVCMMLASNIMYSLFAQFARGIDEVRILAFGGVINAGLLLALSLLFLCVIDIGLDGYYYATVISLIVPAVYMALRCRFWRFFSRLSFSVFREMVSYGMPLALNTIGWWANNFLGRYFVALFCGVGGAGLLAAAYKVPSIPKTIQQVFIQAWQMSSIKEYNENDEDGFFSKTYNVMCSASCLLASVVIIVLPPLSKLMFSDAFLSAWLFIPLLMVGVVFDSLSSIVGGVYMAVGNSKPIAVSAGVAIIVSLVSCLILIPIIGVWGAVVSSVLSSATIWIMRLRGLSPYMKLRVDLSANIICFAVLIIQIILACSIQVSLAWYMTQFFCVLALALALIREIGLENLKAIISR